MKYSVLTLAIVLSLFLVTQFVGLTANSIYLESELPYGLKPPELEPEVSPWFFISMIVVISIIFFVMRKFRFEFLMKLWFFIAFVVCVAITLSAFIEHWIAIIVALAIVMLKFKERDIYVHNLGEIRCASEQMGAIQARLGLSEGELLDTAQAVTDKDGIGNVGYLAL